MFSKQTAAFYDLQHHSTMIGLLWNSYDPNKHIAIMIQIVQRQD